MNICAISDLHGYLPCNLPNADLLIIAGDVCPDDQGELFRSGLQQEDWYQDKLEPWLIDLESKFEYVILTWGNHDFLKPKYHSPKHVTIVNEPGLVSIDEFLFYVSPLCLTLSGWNYTANEEMLWWNYRNIPIGVDVVISHGPALDYLDKVKSGEHVGSRALKKAIQRSRPSYVVCGHIHESFGRKQMDHPGTSHRTIFYNVSQRDEYYHVKDRPVQFKLQERNGFME